MRFSLSESSCLRVEERDVLEEEEEVEVEGTT